MNHEAIAVTGVSTLFAGSPDWFSLWKNIVTGRDLITEVPPSHWLGEDYYDSDPQAPDKVYCRRGSFLDPVGFDALNFGMPPSNVPSTDTSQLLALVLAERLFQDIAPAALSKIDRERISVILGVTGATELTAHMSGRMARPQWEQGLRDSGVPPEEAGRIADRIAEQFVPWQESTFPGLLGNVVAGRIANRFDLGGTNCIVDAACASSLGALSMAVNELKLGQSDLVITGGVDTLNDPLMYLCFSKTPALSMTGDCRPFSDQADGTLLGEGLALLALRRLSDAERDGDHIYAVIKGLGTSSDGRSKSVYAPRSAGQARALDRAYQAAGYDPSTVELVEAHGTATKAGDAAEFEGLNSVFSRSTKEGGAWCALGSIKSQIGHTKAAAGVAGLAKAILALHHKVLPPTIKVRQPNPQFKIEQTPFYLNTEARPWIRDSSHPRRASVSSFGFGGSNFHVALEEHSAVSHRPPCSAPAPSELILISGTDAPSFRAAVNQIQQDIDSFSRRADALRQVAIHSRGRFETSQEYRGAIIAESSDQLRSRLAMIDQHVANHSAKSLKRAEGIYFEAGATPGRVAWLFPGQGSQYVGMGRDLAMAFEAARQVWDQAASLPAFDDLPLHQFAFPRPTFSDEERDCQAKSLQQMEVAQPAIAACSLAALEILRLFRVSCDAVAGHSFGELSALCTSGVITPAETLELARWRGRAMANAAVNSARPVSGMTAVTATQKEVTSLVARFSGRLTLANHNTPNQCVVAGECDSLDALESELSRIQTPYRRLDVAAACHSPLMKSAATEFVRALEQVDFDRPNLPLGWNGSGAMWSGSPAQMKAGLANQLVQPVRFVEMVESLYESGVRTFIELGPGSVLTGLVSKILPESDALAVSIDKKGQHGIDSLWRLLGQLAVRGLSIDWSLADKTFSGFGNAPPADDRRLIPICGSNPGKPYPANRTTTVKQAIVPHGKSLPENPLIKVRAQTADTVDHKFSFQSSETFIVNPSLNSSDGMSAEFYGPAGSEQSGPSPDGTGDPWLATFREVHQQTAQAHQMYLQTVSEAHQAFLQASFGVRWNGPDLTSSPNVELTTAPIRSMTSSVVTQPRLEARSQVSQVNRSAEVTEAGARPTGNQQVAISHQPGSLEIVASPAGPQHQADASDLNSIRTSVFEVVADKTGYSVEVLDPTLEIEAGLGIDSIKRVEILSSLVDRLPGLGGIELTDFATYRTLEDVVLGVHSRLADVGSPSSAAPRNGQESIEQPTPANTPKSSTSRANTSPMKTAAEAPIEDSISDRQISSILLEVVADKTGYPQDLIDLDMEIESGLGIDSIKRVEILSSLIDRFPALGAIDGTELTSQRTLKDLVEKVESLLAPAEKKKNTNPSIVTSLAQVTPEVAAELHPSAGSILSVHEVKLVASAASGFTLPGLRDRGQITIISGRAADRFTAETASELAIQLRRHGLDAVAGESPRGRAVISLSALTPVDSNSVAGRLWDDCEVLQRACANGAGPMLFVAVQQTGGHFGYGPISASQACSAGIAGLAKTAFREWPGASVKSIDLDLAGKTPTSAAHMIADELLTGGTELEVAIASTGARATLRCVPWSKADAKDSAHRFWDFARQGPATFLVSGGAKGVTAATLQALSEQGSCRFIILGRTALEQDFEWSHFTGTSADLKRELVAQSQARGETVRIAEIQSRVRRIISQRDIHDSINSLRRKGAEVRYLAIDVRDTQALDEALEKIRDDWGPIHGIIHGAGVLADKRIVDKQPDQIREVCETKVNGLTALLNATRKDPLRWIALFSSISARIGNAGQCDYAAANEILNKMAHHESQIRGKGCRVISINWGAWNGGMVDESLRGHFEKQGVSLIPLGAGANLFADLLLQKSDPPVEIVVTANGSQDEALLAPIPSCDGRSVVELSLNRFPFVRSHQLKDTPVVPLVLVVEWISRVLRQQYSHLKVIGIHDLKVLKGISLADRNSVQQLHVVFTDSHQNGTLTIQIELRGAGEVVHYRCSAELAPESHRGPATVSRPVMNNGREWPWSVDEAYEILFHGPDFHVLQSLDQVNEKGASATLVGTSQMDWPGGPWSTDPAALDGALQLALLWGIHLNGRASLPSSIKSIRFYLSSPMPSVFRCDLQASLVATHQHRFNIHLSTPDGAPIVDLMDVDMTVLPSGFKNMSPTAFS